MLYILTNEELEDCKNTYLEWKSKAFDASRFIANNLLMSGMPHGCVVSGTADYCDRCPAIKFCSHKKHYSK